VFDELRLCLRPPARLLVVSLATLCLCATRGVWAKPRAGTVLSTHAAATYLDSATGSARMVTSNSVGVAVAQVSGVTVASGPSYGVEGQIQTAAASITVFNAGNGPDAFDLRIVPPPGWTAQLYLDTNRDGKHQAAEPAASQTATLEPGNQANVVLVVSLPQQAQATEANVLVTAVSSHNSSVNDSDEVQFVFEPANFLPELYSPAFGSATGPRGPAICAAVVYRDRDGEAPDDDQPVVWINNPDETQHTGLVSELDGALIVDGDANWVPGQFRGDPVQVDVPGQQVGIVYTVIDNTEITLHVDGNPQADGIAPGQSFRLRQVILIPQTGELTTGKTYANLMPATSVARQAHFSVTSQQNYGGEWRTVYVRNPTSGEWQIPVIAANDDSNRAPTLRNGAVTPAVCGQADMVTMTVTYSDPNGDSPSISGARRGYIWAVVDGYPHPMTVDGASFIQGVNCAFSLQTADLGTHSVYFVASDGYVRVQYPAEGTLSFRVNSVPALSQPTVSPLTGSQARAFTYSVVYSDADGLPPQSVSVLIDGRAVALATDPSGGTDYTNGVRYRAILRGSEIGIGPHTYQFMAADGFVPAASAPQSPATGPTVAVNNPPSLSGGSVNPTFGTNKTVFRFTVTYTDSDGDPPAYLRAITGNERPITMARSAGVADYQNGVTYNAEAYLPPGHHLYRFEASDSAAVAQDPPGGGGRDGVDVVPQHATQIVFDMDGRYVIGEPSTISGSIQPAVTGQAVIILTRPNQATLRYTTDFSADGRFSIAFTPDMTGLWRVSASWDGNEQYVGSSAETALGVGGPALVTSGLQMIGLPYIPVDPTPLGTFGRSPAFMVARWLPAQSKYAMFDNTGRFRSDNTFPAIAPGCGYWFGTTKAKLVLPAGRLVDQNSAFSIDVTAGWNQIGFVYLAPSAWASTKVQYGGKEYTLMDAYNAGILDCFAWTYDGAVRGYKVVHPTLPQASRDLEPWRGYWVYAAKTCRLVLQPPSQTQTATQGLLQSVEVKDEGEWAIRLSARLLPTSEGQESPSDGDNFIGVSPAASEANFSSPTYHSDYVDLYFAEPFGAESPGRYASDFRPEIQSGDTWEFVVESDAQEAECAVSWLGMDSAPPDLSFILEDLETGEKMDMRLQSEYRYPHRKGADRRFRIVVGG